MAWQEQLRGDPLPWLLESDSPGVRFLVLRDILALPHNSGELCAARRAAYHAGPIATVLAAMDETGYWVEPGLGYNPKYLSTVWSVILLAQLGAHVDEDQRVATACAYLVAHALTQGRQFTASGAPAGTADSLQGNLCWALLEIGCADPALDTAFEWMARSVTGEGVAPPEDRQERSAA